MNPLDTLYATLAALLVLAVAWLAARDVLRFRDPRPAPALALAAASDPATTCTPWQRARQLLRRYHKPLLAALLLAAYLPLRRFASAHYAASLSGEDAKNLAAQVSNQWVGFWQPVTKLIWTLIFYWLSGFVTFKGLATTPVLPDWATGKYSQAGTGEFAPVHDYKAAFLESLTDAERLAHYEKGAWKEMIRFSACLLTACLLA